jgi:hypothetical protein
MQKRFILVPMNNEPIRRLLAKEVNPLRWTSSIRSLLFAQSKQPVLMRVMAGKCLP